MTPSRILAFTACLAAATAALAGVANATIAQTGQPTLYHEVQPTKLGTTFVFEVPFQLSEPGEAYLKVLPRPDNPVYRNGGPDDGWWTHVVLEDASGAGLERGTNGTGIVEFGRLEADTDHHLRLHVRVPEEALSEPGDLRLRYVLAVRSVSGAGSGGQLDQSTAVTAVVRVAADAQHVVVAENARGNGTPPLLIAGGSALMVFVGGLAIVRYRGRE